MKSALKEYAKLQTELLQANRTVFTVRGSTGLKRGITELSQHHKVSKNSLMVKALERFIETEYLAMLLELYPPENDPE